MRTRTFWGWTLFLIGLAPAILSLTSGEFVHQNFVTAVCLYAGAVLLVASIRLPRKDRRKPTCTYCGAKHADEYPCPQLLDACSRRAARTLRGN